MSTTYTNNTCAVSWSDGNSIAYARPHAKCGHRHRTVEAAARCDRIQRPIRRANPGSTCWIDTRILATEADGTERKLTEDEAYDAFNAADNA